MKKMIAEFLGTFTLVLMGCGAAVLAGFGIVGQLGIAFAFGFAIIAMAYGIGPISGCHVNPAVSLGVFFAGRMRATELIQYIIAQFAGAIAGAAVLYVIATGKADYSIAQGLGQNGYGVASPGGYNLASAIVFEFVATFLFLVTILGVTSKDQPSYLAGLAIGFALVLIHIVGIQVTGVSVNPARSAGPALFAGAQALSQLWVFLVVPSVGGIVAGILFKMGILSSED